MFQEILDGMSQDIVDTLPLGRFHGSGPLPPRGLRPLDYLITVDYGDLQTYATAVACEFKTVRRTLDRSDTNLGVVHGDRNY